MVRLVVGGDRAAFGLGRHHLPWANASRSAWAVSLGIDTTLTWSSDGAVAGDPDDAPPPREEAELSLPWVDSALGGRNARSVSSQPQVSRRGDRKTSPMRRWTYQMATTAATRSTASAVQNASPVRHRERRGGRMPSRGISSKRRSASWGCSGRRDGFRPLTACGRSSGTDQPTPPPSPSRA